VISYAAGDCERIRAGLLAQPVNTLSAAGYLLAGGWLLRMRGRPDVPRRYRWFAAAVAANGVGSGLYHGAGWAASGWCHDVAAISAPVFVAVDGLGSLRDWPDRTVTRVALVTTGFAAAAVLARPATNPVLLTAVTAAGLAEVAARRPAGRGRVVMLGALAVALPAYLLGRSGGPLCRPDSLLQPHALWHLLTAAAMAGWAADKLPRA
jgi:hypothetical protein